MTITHDALELTIHGHLPHRRHQTWVPPPLLTSGGQSMHGLQAGGTHPTGMLSC